MKIYLASKFGKKEEVRSIYENLKEKGHSVSYDWTTHDNIRPYVENQDQAAVYSENELIGIVECDVFIHLSDPGNTLPMEFGAALILAKKVGSPIVYAVGPNNNKSPWYFNSLVRRREAVSEVLDELEDIESSLEQSDS